MFIHGMYAVGAMSLRILLEDFIQPPFIVILGFTDVVRPRRHRLSKEFDRARGQMSNTQIQFSDVRLQRVMSLDSARSRQDAMLRTLSPAIPLNDSRS